MSDTVSATPSAGVGTAPTVATSLATRNIAYPLVCSVLAAAQLAGLAWVIRTALPGYPSELVVMLSALVALEGVVTSRWLAAGDRKSYARVAYRLCEIVLIAFFVTAAHWLHAGGASTQLSASAATTFCIVLFAWFRAVGLDGLLTRLSISAHEASLYRRYKSREERDQHLPRRPQSRASLAREVTSSWLIGALVVVVFAGLASLQLDDLERTVNVFDFARLGLPPFVTISVIVYVIGGLWLLASARQQAMNEWWMVSDARKHPSVDRSCARATYLCIGIAALVASLLPSGDVIPLLAWLKTILAWGSSIIDWVIAVLSRLLGTAPEMSNALHVDPVMPADLPDTPFLPTSVPRRSEPVNIDFGPVLLGAIGLLLLVAVLVFFRGRFRIRLTTITAAWAALIAWLSSMLSSTSPPAHATRVEGQPNDTTQQELASLRRRRQKRKKQDNALRAKLMRHYLNTLKQARKQGVERFPGETPAEHARQLHARWPQGDAEIKQLTEAFNEVRYGNSTVTEQWVETVRDAAIRFKQLQTRGGRS